MLLGLLSALSREAVWKGAIQVAQACGTGFRAHAATANPPNPLAATTHANPPGYPAVMRRNLRVPQVEPTPMLPPGLALSRPRMALSQLTMLLWGQDRKAVRWVRAGKRPDAAKQQVCAYPLCGKG